MSLADMYACLTRREKDWLHVEVLIRLFADCKRKGLSATLGDVVPQSCRIAAEPQNISVMEFGHLIALLIENAGATELDAVQRIASIKGTCRGSTCVDASDVCSQVGILRDQVVHREVFYRLVMLLSAVMQIETDQLLYMFAWVEIGVFELTEDMAEAILSNVFLKPPGPSGSSLDAEIKSNDFMRMVHVQKLTDAAGKTGIHHAQLSLFFGETLRKLPNLVAERDRKRRTLCGMRITRASHHKHGSIKGRRDLSILLQQLFLAMRVDLHPSPFAVAISLLQNAKAIEDTRVARGHRVDNSRLNVHVT